MGISFVAQYSTTACTSAVEVGTTTPIHWAQADATCAPLCIEGPTTVVANPPFGAQDGRKHADRAFLETTAEIADVSYTVHNAGSRDFVEAFVADVGGEVTHAFEATFDLDRQFDFHEADSRELTTEVFRVVWD